MYIQIKLLLIRKKTSHFVIKFEEIKLLVYVLTKKD